VRLTIIGINYAPEPTGIAPYTTGAAEGLRAAGEEVTVVTGYPHYPWWRIAEGYTGWQRRELLNKVPVRRLRHPVPRRGSLIARTAMEVVFGLRACLVSWAKPEVTVAITPALLSSAMVVARARLTRRPVVVWVQDIYTLGATQTGLAARAAGIIGAIESWTLRRATRVVVIHDRFAAYVTAQLGVDSTRVDVVRNWTHISQPVTIDAAATRERHGWREDDIVVLHAGNMGAKQNLDSVVRASALAAVQGSRVRFVLLGDGNQRKALQSMGANANLQFIDPLPDDGFAATLRSADILLVNELPGMTEMSVPSKLTSYFDTGLPVLAAVDAGSVTASEIEASGGGIRVEPDDPAALLAAAEALAADPQLCHDLGTAGRDYRNERLSASTAVAGLAAALHRAARA
jgi:glycosyltransferase involved in cell wall biosynthesis